MANFVIYTDSASDIPTEIREEFNIKYFPMKLVIDGKTTIADLDWKKYSSDEFYNWLKEGRNIKTSLITMETFDKMIRAEFEKGNDVLYLGCSTALTGSINTFNLAKEILMEDFPDRRMEAPSTFAAAATLGMLVVEAARIKENGGSLDAVIKWVENNKFFFNQFCTVDTLTYLKAAGRCKGIEAFFGNFIGVKPVFISDRKGNNFVIEKVRGTKASLDCLYEHIKDVIIDPENNYVVINHSCVPERAAYLRKRFLDELHVYCVYENVLGPIVGTTCGPGTIAVFCYGKEVTRYDGDGIAIKSK